MKKTSLAVLAAALAVTTTVAQGWSMIHNKGSDTLINVAQALAEEYQKIRPDIAIPVTGGGTGMGVAALLDGKVEIANASRGLEEKEIKLAEKKGIHPKELTIGFDALAVFVHKSNPLNEISLDQLARLYGDGGDITSWQQLGVEVAGCQGQKIVLISRMDNSGTYAYFREAILHHKDFVRGTRDLHGSKDVVDLVGQTACAIGYSGMAYADNATKMLKIKRDTNTPGVEANVDNAISKSYPIARPLFMVTNGEPKGEIRSYLDWIMSKDGQCLISKRGYAPVVKHNCK